MVYLERIDNPFSEFYMESFCCIKEEQKFKDALKYQTDFTDGPLKNQRIIAFKYHEYSFLTFLLKNEANSWLGYINLYNDKFVKNQISKFICLSLPYIIKIREKNNNHLINSYYQKLYNQKCLPYDMDQIMQIIFDNYLKIGGTDEELEEYFLKCQKLLEERPNELYIEFALYEWLNIFPEDINYLLNELCGLLEQDPVYQNSTILLKCDKSDIILNNNEYFFEKSTNDSRRLIKRKY